MIKRIISLLVRGPIFWGARVKPINTGVVANSNGANKFVYPGKNSSKKFASYNVNIGRSSITGKDGRFPQFRDSISFHQKPWSKQSAYDRRTASDSINRSKLRGNAVVANRDGGYFISRRKIAMFRGNKGPYTRARYEHVTGNTDGVKRFPIFVKLKR